MPGMLKPMIGAASLLTLAACGSGGHSDDHDHDHDHDHAHGEAPIELVASVEEGGLTIRLEAPVTVYGLEADASDALEIDNAVLAKFGSDAENSGAALTRYYVLPEAAGCEFISVGRGMETGANTSVSISIDYACASVDKLDALEVRLTEVEGFDHIDAIALRGDGQREAHLEGDENTLDLR